MRNGHTILSMSGTSGIQNTQTPPGYLEYDGNYSNYISEVDGIISDLNNAVSSANVGRDIYHAGGGAVREAKRRYKSVAKSSCSSVEGKNAVLVTMRSACNQIPNKKGILRKRKKTACNNYVTRKTNEFESWRNKGCAGGDEGDYPDDSGNGGLGGSGGGSGNGGGRPGADTSQAGFGGASPEQTKQILMWGGIAILTAAVIAGGIYGYKALMKPAAKPKLLTA